MTPVETFAQSRAEAEQLIRQHAPARLQDAVIERLLPAIALDTKRARDVNVPIGASKFFGAPDVPQGFEWPLLKPEQIKKEGNKIFALWPFKFWAQVKKEDNEVFTPWPLKFWAQINLREMAPFDASGLLPTSGSLLFFYDSKPNQWCVMHVEGELTRAEIPQYEYDSKLQVARISAQSIWSIPLFAYWSDESQDDGQPWDLSHILNLDWHPHYLLGNPQQYTSDRVIEARVRAAYRTNRGQTEDWLLLLQMGDDRHFNSVVFGDEFQSLFFLIHRDDLAARDFSSCHVVCERQF